VSASVARLASSWSQSAISASNLGNDAVLFGEDVERAEPPSKLRN
jgi:hypothetical protein